MNKTLRFLSIACTLLLLPFSDFAQTQFWSDNFEDSGSPSSGTRTSSYNQGGGGSPYRYYFLRTDGNNIELQPHVLPETLDAYQNFSGIKFWAGEDLDKVGTGSNNPSDKIQTIEWDGINISGKTGVTFKGLFAANGGIEFQTINFGETYDFMAIEYRIDGGSWTAAGGVYPDLNGAGNYLYGYMREDTDGNKIGDGQLITRNFKELTMNINGTGTTLDLRFRASADASLTQEIAIDNFRLLYTGATDATPPSVSGITVSGAPADNAASVTYTVAFNENAKNISTDDFQLTATGSASGTISSVSASSGSSVDVTVNSISGTGSLRLDLKSNTNITDNTGNGNGTNGYVTAYNSGSVHTVATGIALATNPTLTFSNATGFGDNIASDGEGGSTAISDFNLDILPIDNTGAKLTALPLEYHDNTESSWSDYPAIIIYGGDSVTPFYGWSIKADNGDNFNLKGLDFHDVNWEGSNFVIKAFRDGSALGSVTFTGNTTGSYIPLREGDQLTNIFKNVDEVRIYRSDQNDSYIALNNVQVGPATVVSNTAPTATSVSYTGTLTVGQTLTGTYTYADTDNDTENGSTYKWYRSDDASGTNKTAISSATSATYTLVAADAGKYISFEVTPNDGTVAGTAVESNKIGPVVALPIRVYVNKNIVGGDGSGNSWTNAKKELADALKEMKTNNEVGEIWVAGGTYKPMYSPEDGVNFGTDKGRDNTFLMVKDVKVYGGFAGTETTLADRDLSLTANASILSGDIDNNDSSDGTITGDNVYHVVVSSGDAGTATLNGFTIKGGKANGGGGTITIGGNSFKQNSGAGIYNSYSSPLIESVTISYNITNGGDGAGICNINSNPKIVNSVIHHNGGSTYRGGGVYNATSAPELINVTIADNTNNATEGSVINDGGTSIVKNSIIWGNTNGISGNVATVSNSIVQGGYAGTSVLDADPQFINTNAGDYSLSPSSPAVNKGDNTLFAGLNADTKDLAGNARVYKYASSGIIDMGAYELQADATTAVTAVDVPINRTYITGDELSFVVKFSDNVNLNTTDGTPRLALTIGSITRYATYQSGSGTKDLVFKYTVQSGDVDADGIAVGALSLNGGTIKDAANHDATLTLKNVGSTTLVLVDGIAPSVTAVSSSTNGTYKIGSLIPITVAFNEAVTVIGTPQLTLETGATDRTVNYTAGSGSSILTFNYVVQAGDASANLDYTSINALSLNGGTIKDVAGNSAVLTLASPGAAGSLSYNTDLVIDGIAPTVTITSDVNTLKKGETAEVTFTFSEAPGSSFSWDGSSGDITVTGGTLSAISGSGTIYTATFTPTDDTNDGTASITIAANSYADAAGNGGTAGTTPSLTFDTKAPTTTVATLALSNDSGSSNTDFITNVAAQTISGTLSANLQTGETVEISLDNGSTWSIASATTGQNTYSLNSVTLTGSNTLQARVKDLAGNINTAVFSQAYVLDTTAPDAPGTPDLATASDSGSSSTDNLTNNTTPEFTGTTTLNTVVNVYDGSTLLGVATVSGTSWNYTSTSLTEGSHSITAKATDIAGNVSSASVALAITIDVTAPAIPIGFSVTEENTQNTLNWTANGETDLNTYKVYSGTTANPTVSLTSIVAGTNSFTHTGLNNGTTYYYRITATDEAGNESVYSTEESGTPKGPQTITFAALPSKTYGDADFAPGATASSGLTVSYSSDNTNVATIVSGNIHIVGAGTATITASQPGNSSYIPASDQTQTLNVSSKKLTAELISPVSKTYDGSTTATLNNANYSLPGVVNSDEVNLNNPTTGNYDNKNVGNGKTVSVNGLSISGADANNYELTATTASANIGAITTKTLTITATGISKEYDGNALATVNLSDDRVNGDDISASYTATFDNKNVGLAKPISVTAISISGADKDNYTFNTTASTTADITAKALTITATGINKVYNGNTDATVTLSDDRVNGDDISASYTATFDNKNVGSAKAINVTGISISGSDKDNYTFNSTASTTADITAKALTITATGISKEYDGNTLATVNLGDDRVSSDDITASYTATFDNKNVGSAKAVSVTGISINGTDKDNYTFNSTAGTTADITAKALTVTATGINKVYDGNTTATVTLSDDRVNNDDITTTYSSAIFNDKNVGTGKAVSVNGIGISGADKDNYTFNTTASTTADITTKALAITATGISKVYDGNTTATVNLSDDRVNGDDISASYTATFDNKNVGSAKAISVTGISISGVDKDNYTFNSTASTSADITAKALTITATGISKEYDGNTTATVTLSDDRVSGDDITASYTATFDNKNVGIGKAVSVTGISISGTDKDNYTFNSTAGTTADITAKPLTITADDKEKYEGETNPDLTASYNGFITGEDSAVLDVQPVMNTIADENSLQGTYPITASGASAQNYSISYVPGTLTVHPGAPTSISLAGTTLYENSPAGTQAGTLSSTSLSPTATYTYTLVSGTGDEDNSSFAINGNQLVTATSLNFESKQTYNIRVRSTTQYNLSLEQTFTVNLEDVNEAPTLDAVADQKVCYTTARQDIALSGISAGPDAGQTVTVTANSSNNGLLSELSINNNELRYRVADGQSGTATITVTVKDNGGTANGGTDEISRTFTLTVNPLPVSTISSDRGNSISKGETAVLTVASDNGISYSWSNATGIVSGQNSAILTVRPMETTTYTVLVTNASGCQSTATYTVTVNGNYQALKPENFFTPNSDGINDTWVVENIDAYPGHTLTIFDRGGRKLYETKNYQNDWNGTANGADLQEGTYYYIFRFDDPKVAPIKGFITIVR